MLGHGRPPSTKILIVDDNASFRPSLARLMTGSGYDCREAADVAGARDLLESEPDIAAVVCDVQMPAESGLGLLSHLAADHPDAAVVMTTAFDDPETVRLAFEMGADGYLIKPFTPNAILVALANALRRHQLDSEQRGHSRGFEHTIARLRTLTVTLQRIENGPLAADNEQDVIDRISRAISLRHEEAGGHIERMSRYAALLADVVGVTECSSDQVRLATALHDVGNIGVPDAILLKPGSLSRDEYTAVQRHAQIGYQLLAGSTSELLAVAAGVALSHHEWWDGGGYPRGIRGNDIPEVARIAAVTDVFDALTSRRLYRPVLPFDEATATMTELRGRQFEPRLLDAFLGLLDEIAVIRQAYPDRADDQFPIRVLVVDSDETFLTDLVRLLDAQQTIKVVGTAANLTLAEQVAATARIRSLLPAIKVVMLTDRTDHHAFVRAIGAGCAGFVSKTDTVDQLVGAIRVAYEGDALTPVSNLPEILYELTPTSRGLGYNVSPREVEVLRLVASGLPNKAIGERLYISVNTVRNHVQRILYKLDAHSRLEAVATAVREGLIARDREVVPNS